MRRNWCLVSAMVISLVGSMTVMAAWGQDNEVKGTIISRDGDTLIVKSAAGNVTVALTDSTFTKDDTGFFGLDKEMGNVVLVPGLKVKVEGSSGGKGQFTAEKITVDGDDLETAEMIQAGLHPTAEQVEENVRTIEEHNAMLMGHSADIKTLEGDSATHRARIDANEKDIEANTTRFMALSEFDVKGEASVKFNVGSAKISPEDEEQLKKVAEAAVGLKGYIVEVTGFADSTGSAAMNTKLSEERAKAVVTFLMQQGNVPVRHIVAPGAMGEFGAKAPNETAEGRAENRRVEVKVLVNKGISGT